jgi:hypothetical protein
MFTSETVYILTAATAPAQAPTGAASPHRPPATAITRR